MKWKLILQNRKITLISAILVAFFAFLAWCLVPVLQPVPTIASTKVLARDGSLLYEVPVPSEGLRTPVPLSQIPKLTIAAVLAAEDQRFYEHHGVDVVAIARAIKDNLLRGRIVSGASTITEQLVKNLYFADQPRSVSQKIRELVASVAYSALHSKDEILEQYLNTVYLGNQSYGIQAAARNYFHKEAGELSVGESALLAGIIAAPSAYDPYRQGKLAGTRKTYVLSELEELGKISSEEKEYYQSSRVQLFPIRHQITAPHFVFMALEEAGKLVPGATAGNHLIRTTLDPELQRMAEATIKRRLLNLAEQNVTSGAVVALQPENGEVLTLVGSSDYFNDEIQGKVNMATALRQPGSALKPFMYLAAFLKGMSPATVVADLPVRFETLDLDPYYPRNYNYVFHGPVSIRQALGSSLNVPAVKVLDEIGLEEFFGMLRRFGLEFPESPEYYGLGSVLGGGEVTLFDTTQAYATLANYGLEVPITIISSIETKDGAKAYERPAPKAQSVFLDPTRGEAASAQIADLLSDPRARALSFGEANFMDIRKNIAIKTGTTRDFHDNWAFGYTPEFALGVWVGNADNSAMRGVSGISGAVPIWHDLMRFRHDKKPAVKWFRPALLIEREICAISGQLATTDCPKKRTEWFLPGTEPTEPDAWYQKGCDGAIYLAPPPEYDEWAEAKRLERPPQTDCTQKTAAKFTHLAILSPLDKDIYEIDPNLPILAQRIPFVAGGGTRKEYRWVLNGMTLIAREPIYFFDPKPGEYTLKLEGATGEIHFTVR